MRIKKFHIYLADLNPRMGTEPGKVRPIVVVQTDLLNNVHPSTIICPITTHIIKGAKLLRIHLVKSPTTGLNRDSAVLLDQLRAIDNRRFGKRLGQLTAQQRKKLLRSLYMLVLQ
jgi:mRNA interferase MazF